MELLAKIVNQFCQRLHLRCLTGFCVPDNYLSVKFLMQPYFLHFLVFSGYSTFPIFRETHAPAKRLTTKLYWKDW